MDTGEGGLAPYHEEGGCDVIMLSHREVRHPQFDGSFSPGARRRSGKRCWRSRSSSQGAKPGKGGVLPARVTPDKQSRNSPGRRLHQPQPPSDAANTTGLDQVAHPRLTGRPVGIKTAVVAFIPQRHRG
jgi:hypothetical protein